MIEVNQITRSYGGVKAVDQASFALAAEKALVILGPSGSGKTTLLRLIAGLEVPDEGEIYINGALASRRKWALQPHQRGIGFVFQRPALWPHMTVAQNILFGLNGMPKPRARDRLYELLERTALTGLQHRYPHQLSGGEARRVSIARSLAPCPGCLLMDEPLVHLNRELKEEVLSLILDSVSETHAGLIYVTHDAGEAGRVSDRVLEMKAGRISIRSSRP